MTVEPGVLFAPRSRRALYQGLNRLADVVRPTLGPTPRCVAITHSSPGFAPEMLDDAALIVRRIIQVPNPYIDMGAMLLRNALARTSNQVGDGTATTAVLMQAIVQHGMRYVEAGYSTVELRRGLELGCAVAVAALRAQARSITGRAAIERCASTLTNEEDVAHVLGEIFDIVGIRGHVQVDAGYINTVERQYIEGVYWSEGYISPHFVTDQSKQEVRLYDAAVLVSDLRITSAEQIAPLLDRVVQAGFSSLVIIALDVSDTALSTLLHNHHSGVLRSFVVHPPLSGPQRIAILDDIAALTGAKRISPESGQQVEHISLDALGAVRVAWATNTSFGLRGGQGEPRVLRQRMADITAEINRATDLEEAQLPRERLGKLWGGAAVLRVGAVSRTLAEARRDNVKRLVVSLRWALQDGVVPGGGRALLDCQPRLKDLQVAPDVRAGVQALCDALSAPLAAIAQNAGHAPTSVVARVQACEPGVGFDAISGEYIDLWSAGIFDPTSVVETALTSAVSAAIMALTTDVLIHQRKPKAVINP